MSRRRATSVFKVISCRRDAGEDVDVREVGLFSSFEKAKIAAEADLERMVEAYRQRQFPMHGKDSRGDGGEVCIDRGTWTSLSLDCWSLEASCENLDIDENEDTGIDFEVQILKSLATEALAEVEGDMERLQVKRQKIMSFSGIRPSPIVILPPRRRLREKSTPSPPRCWRSLTPATRAMLVQDVGQHRQRQEASARVAAPQAAVVGIPPHGEPAAPAAIKKTRCRWNEDEVAALREGCRACGNNWAEIKEKWSAHLWRKTEKQLEDKWHNLGKIDRRPAMPD
eukprot:gnl/TRDRNA2_/TRDRNA2_180969_c0_seq1.p1 gnl/TRDRNA2_/TRDRNA2_180969_c0~~gnl/TRDRNA2_/TRDRNA2_180969_c0_seq1.p1  ORF type:complete len:283 (+),score=65.90 gnl/TRDRNA2_/TRDRNA2_180969_c0_seq1:39-887(+)